MLHIFHVVASVQSAEREKGGTGLTALHAAKYPGTQTSSFHSMYPVCSWPRVCLIVT